MHVVVKLYATLSFAIVCSKDKRGYDAFSPREVDLVEQLNERLGPSTKHGFSLANILSLIAQLRTETTFPKSFSDRKFQRAVVENKILQEIVLSATHPFDCKRYHSTPFSEYELVPCLQNAGHPLSLLQSLRDLGLHFDFYPEHGMEHTRFDSNWRVFSPADLDGSI